MTIIIIISIIIIIIIITIIITIIIIIIIIIIIKVYQRVKPGSLGETRTNKERQTSTEYKTGISTVKYK